MLTWTPTWDRTNLHKNGDEEGDFICYGGDEREARARTLEASHLLVEVVAAGRSESGECCNERSAAMVQPKQGLSVLKYIPKAMRPTTSDVSSVALWGTTAALGALWLVQPFDWIKQQISGAPAEEQK